MKKVIFSALVAVVAVSGAFASVSGLRLVSVWGALNTSGPCPSQTTSITCNTTSINNPICTFGSIALYTQAAGRCNVPLYEDLP